MQDIQYVYLNNNPETQPLFLDKKHTDLIKPYMEDTKLPLWRKFILLFLVTKISPTFVEVDGARKLQATPGRERSVNDYLRLFYTFGIKIEPKKWFELLWRWNNSFVNIGYCSTIRRNKVNLDYYSIWFFTNLKDNYKYAVINKTKTRFINWFQEEFYRRDTEYNQDFSDWLYAAPYFISKFGDINNKIFIVHKYRALYLNNSYDIKRHPYKFCRAINLQEEFPDFRLWKNLSKNKNIKFKFHTLEQYS